MANAPEDRTILNVRERPLSSDINQAQSQLDYALRFLAGSLLANHPFGVASSGAVGPAGFVGASFTVTTPGGMVVTVQPGLGYQFNGSDVPMGIGSVTGLDDLSPVKPLVLLNPQNINVPAADPTNARVDLIEAKYNRLVNNPQSRDALDPVTGKFIPGSYNKTLTFELDGLTGVGSGAASAPIYYKTGTPSGSPAVPVTDAGYIEIARVFVPAAAAALTAANVNDWRNVASPDGMHKVNVTVLCDLVPGSGTFGQILRGAIAAPPGCKVAAFLRSIPGTPTAILSYLEIYIDHGPINRAGTNTLLAAVATTVLGGLGVTTVYGAQAAVFANLTTQPTVGANPAQAVFPATPPLFNLHGGYGDVQIYPVMFDTGASPHIFDQNFTGAPVQISVDITYQNPSS